MSDQPLLQATDGPKTLADVQARLDQMNANHVIYSLSYREGFGDALDLCEQVLARVEPGGLVEAVQEALWGESCLSNLDDRHAQVEDIARLHDRARWQADRARWQETLKDAKYRLRVLDAAQTELATLIVERLRWQERERLLRELAHCLCNLPLHLSQFEIGTRIEGILAETQDAPTEPNL